MGSPGRISWVPLGGFCLGRLIPPSHSVVISGKAAGPPVWISIAMVFSPSSHPLFSFPPYRFYNGYRGGGDGATWAGNSPNEFTSDGAARPTGRTWPNDSALRPTTPNSETLQRVARRVPTEAPPPAESPATREAPGRGDSARTRPPRRTRAPRRSSDFCPYRDPRITAAKIRPKAKPCGIRNCAT